MKKARINSNKGSFDSYVMENRKDMEDYFKLFPNHNARIVRKNFEESIDNGEVLLVNSMGGYCPIGIEDSKIEKYL